MAGSETAKGNYARSLELARPALAAFEQSPEGLFVLATDYLKTGDRAAAARLVEEWRRLAGVSHAASVRFAQLLAEGGLVAEAIDVLEHVRQTDGPFYELAFALGGALPAERRSGGGPSRPTTWLSPRGRTRLSRCGRRPRSPSGRASSSGLSRTGCEPGRSSGTIPRSSWGSAVSASRWICWTTPRRRLTRAARLRPDEPAYQYTLAVAKAGKKQYEEAQALLEPLVEERPDDAQLQYALGSVLYIRGHLEDAAARLRESVRLQPEQLASPYYLALIDRDQGRDAEAIEGLTDLLRRYPDHAPSCEVLGGLLLNEQRYAEAETYLRRAVHFNPESMKANYQLGLLLARTGRREEAARQLELASTLREEDEEASRLQLRLLDPDL